ncbi:uncharacterized protein LOC111705883 isoform X2 [Eurytemora carolleeae]|uniref:uncharacterized protein LOC111705883 isoform X2 n=1 Tax=Eurytemora carolleeae TaxID=1294199 RepID=UPI000C75B991|nr:uncharacterized protein LOC111705883 isoform X2 [Eurytemora carolleeae]|eukprot:XP_023334351.1 uncharacterized protein LOC111705883 isoform X2 [Eurytemora affinis]
MEWVRIIVLLLAMLVNITESKLECRIEKDGDPAAYRINQETVSETRKSADAKYQIFICKCPDSQRLDSPEVYGDTSKSFFDSYHYKQNELDWSVSNLLIIMNCKSLKLCLGSPIPEAIHNFLQVQRAGILVQNITALTIDCLDIGQPTTGASRTDKITSLYIRDSTIVESKYDIVMEDKTEVVFENVVFKKPVFFDVYNSNKSTANPVFRLLRSKLFFDETASSGTINKLIVENDHKKDKGCSAEYSGMIEILGNDLGYINTEDIQFKGGQKLVFENNIIPLILNHGIKVINQREVSMRKNHFGITLAAVPVHLYYRQQNSRCGVKDLLYEEIKMINMGENMVSRRVNLFLLEEEYTQNIQEKMEVSSTYYFTMCECGDVGKFDNTSSGIINQKLYYQSYCLNGTQLRRRDDACDPDCISCMFTRKAGDLTGSAVIAAAVISAVVTGVLTAVLVGICCRFCTFCAPSGDEVQCDVFASGPLHIYKSGMSD